jgi:ribose transport system substrate-binding protein
MGYEGVKIALAASQGDQVPASVDTGATAITKANMNSARSQKLLNPENKRSESTAPHSTIWR